MPELLDRRKQDLLSQFEALPLELEHWRDVSKLGEPYEKHHSQVDALSKQMLALNEKVKGDWNSSCEFQAIQRAQIRCAAVQTVWNYFREKLLLRLDSHLGRYLKAADAYAWACYEPMIVAQRAKTPEQPYREPPLVTFHSEVSPWALSRQSRYDTEQDPTGVTGEKAFEQVRSALPIPLLGIPWHTTLFLPKLAVLAHETGHVVESDFGLEQSVERELKCALKKSELCDGWSRYWRKEIFADLFACYAAGPSFVWALADSLPESPATVSLKKRPSGLGDDKWGKYPPPTLRILLNTGALKELGFTEEAEDIATYWKGDYTTHAMQAFENDLEPVVQAVFRGAALPSDLKYNALAQQETRAHKTISLDSILPLNEAYNPRALVAVACAVHRKPLPNVSTKTAWQRLQDHIVNSRPPGLLDKQAERAKAFVPTKTTELAELIFKELGDLSNSDG
jgi:hypothetical protein